MLDRRDGWLWEAKVAHPKTCDEGLMRPQRHDADFLGGQLNQRSWVSFWFFGFL